MKTMEGLSTYTSARSSRVTGRKTNLWRDIKINRGKYLMMAPYLVFFTFFIVIPVIASIALSFTYFNMIEQPRWIGLLNYESLFLNDDVFLIGVKNTLIFTFLTGPVSYFMALILAWFINEFRTAVRAVLTLIFYIPSISGSVFIIWAFIFSGDAYGLANGFLMKFGILREPVMWLSDPDYNLYITILVQLWLSLGAGFLAFIAGLKSIPGSLYDAGAIDGVRNRWQELVYITLPSMKPQLMFGAVMQIAATFAVSTVPMTLTGFPSTNYSTHTVVTHIIDYGTIRFEMGYGSAIATVLFLVMLLTKSIIGAILKQD